MKLLPLINSSLLALVDDDDYYKCLMFTWKLTSDGYVSPTTHKERGILLHRFVLDMDSNDKHNVDHINRVRHDCQRYNLRRATQTENNLNNRIRTDNKSGFKGVSWDKGTSKWRAQGRYQSGKIKYIGVFIDKLDAAKAREEFMLQEWGELITTLNLS